MDKLLHEKEGAGKEEEGGARGKERESERKRTYRACPRAQSGAAIRREDERGEEACCALPVRDRRRRWR